MVTNETVKAWLQGAYSSKEGSNYCVVIYDNDGQVGAEYFLTIGEALAAAEALNDRLIFVARIR